MLVAIWNMLATGAFYDDPGGDFYVHLDPGVDEMIIEQRGELENGRDRRVIVGALVALGQPGLTYDWKDKSEPLVWPADAVCGALREWLLQEDVAYFNELQALGVISDPIYLN